jgi:hypothetical protein
MERYETTADYNRWGEESEFRDVPGRPGTEVVSMHNTTDRLDGYGAAPATAGAATVAAADGMRTVFLNEFLKQGYARHQASKLRKRRQGNNEPRVEYYYEVMNLCRLVDLQMAEAKKLEYLFD